MDDKSRKISNKNKNINKKNTSNNNDKNINNNNKNNINKNTINNDTNECKINNKNVNIYNENDNNNKKNNYNQNNDNNINSNNKNNNNFNKQNINNNNNINNNSINNNNINNNSNFNNIIDNNILNNNSPNNNKIINDMFHLKSINIRINSGKLIAIIGTVGSGKSSLLSAILGEMQRQRGLLEVIGRMAYLSQIPWIQNLNVKENILFGQNFDQRFYDKVLDCCALRRDLELLQDGDMTEIGEKVSYNFLFS